MSEASRTLDQTMSEASCNVIGLQELRAGPTLCDSQDGPMTDLFGQVLAPASRSAPPASSVAATMSATYGLRSSTSSASAALQQSLANRLAALLDTHGSTMWQQTWKAKHTPQRRVISAHTASAPRTFGSGSTGSPWPTPTISEGGANSSSKAVMERGHGNNLQGIAQMAPWPTPMAGTPAQNGYNAAGNNDSSRKTVELAAWPTATVQDAASSGSAAYSTDSGRHSGTTLTDAARMAWATPQARDHKGAMNPGNDLTHNARPLNEQVRLLPGPTSNGSPAQTAKPAQLNAAFSRWLMGYPQAWCVAAISAWHQTTRRKGG